MIVMKILMAVCLAVGLIVGGSPAAQDAGPPAARRASDRPLTLVPAARIGHPRIGECSGIVWQGGAYYAHNDSGDEPVLYRSLTLDFAAAEILRVPGAAAVDWEDIAILDGDLLVGDIGDNELSREQLTLYRVRYVPPAAGRDGRLELVGAYPFRYPDGRHNAEALAVIEGCAHVITKAPRGEGTGVYRFDELRPQGAPGAGGSLIPRRLATLDLGRGSRVSAADYDRERGWLVLLTNREIACYRVAALGGEPATRMRIRAGKCEAICLRGDDLVLTNEGREVFVIEDYIGRLSMPARSD